MKIYAWFRNLPIRYKLLLTYSTVVAASIALGGVVTYQLVRRTIEDHIESELKNSTSALFSMVKTSVAVSIKNHLRAVAEKNREIVDHFYRKSREGALTEAEAKKRAAEVLLSQRIGKTGYIYCINSQGIVVLHPSRELLGTDVSEHEFVQRQKTMKEGYLEYDWKNPGEEQTRPKALYMTYFEPWDWIISASSYRDEFNELVNVDDFRDSILALKFGETGYSYVTDHNGNAIIHPVLRGTNIFEQENAPAQFFREMLERKSGKMVYAWKNPGEAAPREKLVMYNYIPEYQWIVASSSYLDEFYSPLAQVRGIFLITALGSILLALPFTIRLSSSITRPLKGLMARFAAGAEGDLSVRMDIASGDEVGRLSRYFNAFMDRLERTDAELRGEIREREQAEVALRESEDRYRSVMEAAPDPIVVYDMAGQVAYWNPAFTRVFEWELDGWVGRAMDHFVPEENWPETQQMVEAVASGNTISGTETRRRTRSGRVVPVSVSGAPYRSADGSLVGSVIILRDITRQTAAEEALRRSEEMFSKAFRSSPSGIGILRLEDRRFVDVNESLLRMVGASRDEVLGKAPAEVGVLPHPDEGRWLVAELEAQGHLRDREIELHSRSGGRSGGTVLGRVSAEVIEVAGEPCMLATIEDITARRRLEREVIEIGDRERRRIGQDLHDDLGPHLIGVEVLSKVLCRRLAGSSPEDAGHAERIRSLVGEAIRKTRGLARGLCPVHLADNGLEVALKELAQSTTAIYGLECRFRSEEPVRVADNDVATHLYYIVREAVHNAVKHAEATRIVIDLSSAGDRIHLAVEDDGVGIPSAPDVGGMGLRIMGFRAAMIGASLDVGGTTKQGTWVHVSLPGAGKFSRGAG